MRQSWTGAVIIRGFPNPGLGAGGGGPARRASGAVAHFRAARMRPSLVAIAGTSRGVNAAAEAAPRIGQRGHGQEQGGTDRNQVAPGGSAVR